MYELHKWGPPLKPSQRKNGSTRRSTFTNPGKSRSQIFTGVRLSLWYLSPISPTTRYSMETRSTTGHVTGKNMPKHNFTRLQKLRQFGKVRPTPFFLSDLDIAKAVGYVDPFHLFITCHWLAYPSEWTPWHRRSANHHFSFFVFPGFC